MATTQKKKNITNPGTFNYTQNANVTAAQKKLSQIETSAPGAYSQSAEASALQNAYQNALKQKPSTYQSRYQAQVDSALNDYVNRKSFSYNPNNDALYKVFKDLYVSQGQKAMSDTVGRASAMTGGFGNSYAVTAGSQAYQNYLDKLDEKIPELYELAQNRYDRESQDMLNRYSLLSDAEKADFDRYMQNYDKWLNETKLGFDLYSSERAFDYGKYRDRVGDYQANRAYYTDKLNNERSFDYGVQSDKYKSTYDAYRDYISDEQWQKSFDKQNEQWEKNYALQQAELAEKKRQNAISNSLQSSNSLKAVGDKYATIEKQLAKYEEDGNTEGARAYIENLKKTYDNDEVEAIYEGVFGMPSDIDSENVFKYTEKLSRASQLINGGKTFTDEDGMKYNDFTKYAERQLQSWVNDGTLTLAEAREIQKKLNEGY